MTDDTLYDATVRDATRDSEPARRLYETIADRAGWAWRAGEALHLATDKAVVVDLTGPPPSPYRVTMTDSGTWWLPDPDTAVRMIEQHAEPRYTLTEARQVEAKQRCAAEGHRLRVQHAADGSPDSVVCARCPDWWPVSTEHHTYVLDVLRAAMEYAGPDELPLLPGHPWFDALAHYWPDVAERMVTDAEERARKVAAMSTGVVNLGEHTRRLRPDAEAVTQALSPADAAGGQPPATPGPALSLVDAPTAVLPTPRPAGDDTDDEAARARRAALVPLTGGAAQPHAAG